MRRLSCLVWRSLPLTLIVGVTHFSAPQSQPVAYILNLTGTWQLEGQKGTVKMGQPLEAGSRLSTASDNYQNSITIMQRDDLSRTRVTCDSTPNNPCLKPIVIKPVSSEAPASRFKPLISAALSLLLDKPPAVATHFSATLSRGEYVVVEKEDVIALDNENGSYLPSAFPALPPGRYTITATESDGKTPPLIEKIVHSGDGSWQPFRIPTPGLYTISLTDSDGERRADLLILLLPTGEYRAAKGKYDAVKSLTSKWTGSTALADEHLLLRAVLLALDRSS
jgi:hypothetical protein